MSVRRRLLPPIDPVRAATIDAALEAEEVKATPTSSPQPTSSFSDDTDIDSLLLNGLNAIQKLMKVIHSDISTGLPSRETVMNLKDVMAMLHELKKKEAELMDNMTLEELEEELAKRK